MSIAVLENLPGPKGLPIVGSSFPFILNPRGFIEGNFEELGAVYRANVLGTWQAVLLGPEANKFVLQNKEEIFSSELAWPAFLGDLVEGTLIATDGRFHLNQRIEVFKAFDKELRVEFVAIINEMLKDLSLPEKISYTQTAKTQVTAILAKLVFGINNSVEIQKMCSAIISASIAPLKKPIPPFAYWRGKRAKAAMMDKINQTKADNSFSIYNHLQKYSSLSPEERFTQASFLLIAGHDTTTSAISSLLYLLFQNPKWMEIIKEEVRSFPSENPDMEDLKALNFLTLAFKEAVRLYPPLRTLPRRSVKQFTWQGYDFPVNSQINVMPDVTCRMRSVWGDNALDFQPERFLQPLTEEQKWAYIPFGAGPHRCIGAYVGETIAKLFTFHFLRKYDPLQLKINEQYRFLPMPNPASGLPVQLTALSN